MKDPAFLFYPGDFNDGTQDFTHEEVGAYVRILLFQFSQGHLSLDRIKKRLGSADFDRLWEVIKQKFVTDEQNCYFNKRLEFEVNKRIAFCDSRKKSIQKRYVKRKRSVRTTYVQRMENENTNRNINAIRNENEVKGGPGEKKKLCLFANSEFFDIMKFATEIESGESGEKYKCFDVEYYYEIVKNWSAGGKMRTDWIATARNIMLRDLKDSKAKLKPEFQNLQSSKPTHNGKFSPEEMRAAAARYFSK